MIEEIQGLLDQYTRWLRDKSALRAVGGEHVEITTPFLDRHNDCMQIYARKNGEGFVLSDGGDTIEDLRASGCDLETPKRRDLLSVVLAGFGVRRDGDALTVKTTPQEFASRKHNLVQAMLAVNDLFYLAAPVVANLFLEDVAAWLTQCDIRFTPGVRFTGQSGFDHNFDFVIPASRSAPERLVRAMNRPSRDLAEAITFAWLDTRQVRTPASRCYAFLNDQEQAPMGSVRDALGNYDIVPVLWSRREGVRQELAA